MRRAQQCTAVCAAAALALSVLGCRETKVGATAKCGSAEVFQSELGRLNGPLLPLGSMFSIDWTAKPHPAVPLTISLKSTDHVQGPIYTDYKASYNSKLDVSFDATLDQKVEAKLKTLISKSTEVSAKNLKRDSFENVLALLEADAAAKKAVLDRLNQPGHNTVYLVYAVIAGDDLKITLAGADQVQGKVNVFTYGKYELDVAYECNNGVWVAGPGAPLFFKTVALGQAGGKLFIDTAASDDFANVDFSQALRFVWM